MQVPLTQSRRIADLLAEVENGSSESNNAAADVDTDNFEPEPKKRVIPKEIGADNEFVSRADRRNDKRAEVTQDKSSEESVKPLVRRIPPGVQVY